MSIVVVDTGISNLTSVMNALARVGVAASVSSKPADVRAAKVIVLPGVGAFERAMEALRTRGLVDVLRRKTLEERTPLLGICLGMQLLADWSEEHGRHEGLGLLRARVERLVPSGSEYRVPNIGWYDVRPEGAGKLFPQGTHPAPFYFVHSYHVACETRDAVAASIDFGGQEITVAVEHDNLFGCQFHPEKSQDAGLDLLDRFFARMRVDGYLQ